ncbi:MAG: VPLPA-CTERM sorting domain-containing protein [Pseudomonadota bacterium]
MTSLNSTARLRRATLAAVAAAATIAPASGAFAATYAAIQDTTLYQPIGNLGVLFGMGGDSGGIQYWNHESVNGAQALVQFDGAWLADPLLSGDYVATLNVYQICQTGGFVQGCPGDPGAETVLTDVFIQDSAWSELDPTLGFADVTNTGPKATFEQTGQGGWISIDVTDLVAIILQTGTDFGFSFSQEAYPVVRNTDGNLAIATLCDSESSGGICATGNFAPFLEIRAVPLPAAAWLFIAALGSLGLTRRRSA